MCEFFPSLPNESCRTEIMNQPLNDQEFEQLDDILMKYGHDDSMLCVSELDGFLTAIVSGPDLIQPSLWFPVIWGGEEHSPEWESEQEFQQFMMLVMRHMNSIVDVLMNAPEHYEAILMVNTHVEPPVYIAEEWAFGYMKGVDLGDWSKLPAELETWLDVIDLHGREENFSVLEKLSLEEHQQTVKEIEPAVRELYAYWLSQREHLKPLPIKVQSQAGRNDPCPCGSGKKYKKCCLQ